jgi:uncharacterized protein YukE
MIAMQLQSEVGRRPVSQKPNHPREILMSQAIVDPAELRRFAGMLREFNNDLQSRLSAVSGQLNSLSQSWRDQEHLKFAEEFTQHLKLLSRFVEANENHVPYLLRKAERIEEYMQQR